MKSMRDLLAIVDQKRQNLNENIQTAPRPGVPQLSYSEFDPEPAVDPDDPSLSLPDRFTDGDDSIDVPMNFDNKEDGDVLKEQGSQDVINRADAIWDYTPYDIKVENEKYRELVDLIDQGEFDGLDVQEAAGKFMQMVDPYYEPSDSQSLAETQAKHGDGRELYVGIEAYGIKGMKSTPWRKRFKSQAAFEKWLNNTEDDVEVLGTREVNLNDSLTKEGVAEGGPFSYGKPPRKGSVADLAAKKRQEQEKNKKPIEPKDQMVGIAKVTKDVREGQTKFAGEKVSQKPGDQVRGIEKAKSSKTQHPFQGRLVGGAMESQTYYIKHRGTGEIFESFDNLARAQRRYSQLGELQADYRLTKKR
jgi:hypothetical protein